VKNYILVKQKTVKAGPSQWRTNPGHQAVMRNKFCTLAPNIWGSSIRNLLHVTILTSRMLTWFQGFLKKFWSPWSKFVFVSKVVKERRNDMKEQQCLKGFHYQCIGTYYNCCTCVKRGCLEQVQLNGLW